MNISDYVVEFGSDAWTIDYKDASGNYTFVFDCDIDEFALNGATKRLILQSGPPLKNMALWNCSTQADQAYSAMILDRNKKYLESLGYEVELA
ncbi:hypothetical protein [Verrucomicrobium sp. BvORR106]|uniref:hypothetical protein n=1 Tax=Verrucomicrobium sp. BvORR106 TaxID=1403819 RepID=UPI002240F91F|nr:hypothetical protein [Verrucomicrobium sp. BvORR106]